MKKILVVVGLTIAMATGFVACGQKECGICGEMGSCKTYEFLGEKIPVCKDCQNGLNSLKSLF